MTATATMSAERVAGVTPSPIQKNIQALRAVAVGLVVLNHLWPDRITGGYIGVDIFFVISGFLITAHLRREAAKTGRIDLPRFWARRAKRLLPAALSVLLFSTAVTAVWLPVGNRASAFDQIGAAGTYILNWVLSASSLNYFAQGDAESPVTHYWSLSVEEQFYLAWPILIVICLALTTRSSARRRNATMAFVFGLVLVGSFAWAIYSTAATPSAAYFETTGRAWEFAAGGLLAFVPRLTTRFPGLSLVLVWAAWFLLAFAAIRFDSASAFPGALALVPVAATCVLIWVGDVEHSWAPTGLTSLGPVQFVGGISYSLYLWHWPLIIAAPMVVNHEIFARDKLVILLITLTLAYLSKRFIEDPVRTSRHGLLQRPRNILALTALSMVVLLAITFVGSSQMKTRATEAVRALTSESADPGECFGAQSALSGADCTDSHVLADADYLLLNWDNQNVPLLNGKSCQQDRGKTAVLTCSYGVADGTQTTDVAVTGDSHASMWNRALSGVAEDRGLRMHTYLASSCATTLDPDVIFSLLGSQHEECRVWRENAVEAIRADPAIDVVVTSSYDGVYLGAPDADGKRQPDSGAGYVAAWNEWLDAGKRVIVINEVPEREEAIPACISRNPRDVDPCATSSDIVSAPGPLEQAAAQIKNPNFEFVDFTRVFCDADLCHSVVGGIPVYLDSNHLTAPFVRSMTSEFTDMRLLANTP